jgi:Alpha-acetolactate decarboxylase
VEREHHALFQASTIAALLDGAYEGDLSFAELAEHGDLERRPRLRSKPLCCGLGSTPRASCTSSCRRR